MSARWFVSPDNKMRFADWQGESHSVVYQPSSGDLHLLNRSAARLLSLLQEHPASGGQLQQRYTELIDAGENRFENAENDTLQPLADQSINQHLFQFRALGLIESIDL